MQTFVERDLRRLGFEMAPAAMRRFLTMMAHLHGQRWNASAVGSSLALSQNTVRRYLDLLSGAYLTRQLHPRFENVGKRLVKSPKVYVRDSGLLHGLLGPWSANAMWSPIPADLKLDHLFVVYPGEDRFPLAERVTAIGLADIGRDPG